jgi:hypothetical protein
MPSIGFASGLLDGYFGTLRDERKRREDNALEAAKFLLSTGRVRNMNDLLPFVGELMGQAPGKSTLPGAGGGLISGLLGGKGKGGGGRGSGSGGGKPQPHDILTQFLNPALKMAQESGARTAGGQARPSFPAPATAGTPPAAPAAGPLMLEDEVTQHEAAAVSAANQTKLDQQLGFERRYSAEIRLPEQREQEAARLEQARVTAAARYGPGTLQGRVNSAIDAFTDANGRAPTSEELPAIIDQARAAWQAAGRKESDYKTFEQTWLKDAAAVAGNRTLSAGEQRAEMLKARKAWALAGMTETPGQKLDRAMALERFRLQLSTFTPADIAGLAQSVTIGDQTTRYFDIGSVSGVKEKNQASKAAMAQGIIPVTTQQTQQLEAAGAANANLIGFLDQIRASLPADAANRPLTSIENKLSQWFQTDEALASAMSWDTSVIPLLRALQVTNRITNFELGVALRARPLITDTVGTAARKVAIVQQQLKNGASQVLTRGPGAGKTGGAGGAGAGAGPGTAPPPAAAPANRIYYDANGQPIPR